MTHPGQSPIYPEKQQQKMLAKNRALVEYNQQKHPDEWQEIVDLAKALADVQVRGQRPDSDAGNLQDVIDGEVARNAYDFRIPYHELDHRVLAGVYERLMAGLQSAEQDFVVRHQNCQEAEFVVQEIYDVLLGKTIPPKISALDSLADPSSRIQQQYYGWVSNGQVSAAAAVSARENIDALTEWFQTLEGRLTEEQWGYWKAQIAGFQNSLRVATRGFQEDWINPVVDISPPSTESVHGNTATVNLDDAILTANDQAQHARKNIQAASHALHGAAQIIKALNLANPEDHAILALQQQAEQLGTTPPRLMKEEIEFHIQCARFLKNELFGNAGTLMRGGTFMALEKKASTTPWEPVEKALDKLAEQPFFTAHQRCLPSILSEKKDASWEQYRQQMLEKYAEEIGPRNP